MQLSQYRLLAFALLAALLGFLVVESNGQNERRRELDVALKEGTIGGLNAEETYRLSETLRAFAKAVGIKEELTLNSPYRSGTLQVYTTTPAARKITHCGRGNAVYDAELDAIFVDMSVVKPLDSETRSVDDDKRKPNNQLISTYLHFVLLHEMGHRQLHRSSGGFFDSTKGDLQRTHEDEADDFAIANLIKIYKQFLLKSQAVASGLYGGSSGMAWLNAEELMDEDFSQNRVTLDIVMALFAMTKELQLSNYPFSPFYSDEAHANLVERSLRILQALDRVENLDRAISNRRNYLKAFLQRLKLQADVQLMQIEIPGWIAEIAFAKQDLWIVSNIGQSYRFTRAEIERSRASKRHTAPERVVASAYPRPDNWFAWLDLPSSESASTFGHGKVEDSRGQEAPIPKSFSGHYLLKVHQQDENGKYRQAIETLHSRQDLKIVITDADAHYFTVMEDGEIKWQENIGAVLAEYGRLAGERVSEGFRLKALNWMNGYLFFLVSRESSEPKKQGVQRRPPSMSRRESSKGRTLTFMRCEAAALKCDRIYRMMAPEIDFRAADLAVADDGPTIQALGLARKTEGDNQYWQLWKLKESVPPAVILERPFLANEIKSLPSDSKTPDLVDNFFEGETEGSINGIFSLNSRQVLLNFKNDSCFLFDAAKLKLRPVFHPCATALKFAESKGDLVVSTKNAGKAFLIQLD